jgi:hypothetical protein
MDEVTNETYAIHFGAGSWLPPTFKSVFLNLMENLKLDNVIRKLLGKPLKYV